MPASAAIVGGSARGKIHSSVDQPIVAKRQRATRQRIDRVGPKHDRRRMAGPQWAKIHSRYQADSVNCSRQLAALHNSCPPPVARTASSNWRTACSGRSQTADSIAAQGHAVVRSSQHQNQGISPSRNGPPTCSQAGRTLRSSRGPQRKHAVARPAARWCTHVANQTNIHFRYTVM